MNKALIIILFQFFLLGSPFAQVSIGKSTITNDSSVLDLSNFFNKGLLLNNYAGVLDTTIAKPIGMLYFDSLYLFISQDSLVARWNALSPWIFDGDTDNGIEYGSVGRLGIGIGINVHDPSYDPTPASRYYYPTNLHIGQGNNEVINGSSTSSSVLIGNESVTPNYEYLLMDNDEIMNKQNNGSATTLYIQDTVDVSVQIGRIPSDSAVLNVHGKVKENGGHIQPQNTIIMWTGDTLNNFTNGLGTGRMTGWAICNGKTYNYNGLNIISPNLQGRFIVGYGTRGSYTFIQKDYEGNDEIMQTQNQVGKHTHGDGSLITSSSGSHTHDVYRSVETNNHTSSSLGGDLGDGSDDGTKLEGSIATDLDGNHFHHLSGATANNAYAGAQQAMPNTPPYYVVVYLLKLY